MELEKTDQEQVEELQKWWRENRLALVGGLVLGIGALVGWEQWQDSRGESAMAASQSYTAVERAAQGEDAEAAQAAMRELEQAHPGSVYLVHGYSALAAQAAQAEDWPAAVEALQQALDSGPDGELRGLLRLRLARAQWAAEQPDAARATLQASLPAAFEAQARELAGDIAWAQGDREAARSDWEAAAEAAADGPRAAQIRRKLDRFGTEAS